MTKHNKSISHNTVFSMNKRIAALLVALSVSAHAWAQDEGDALRYSRVISGGTARTQAIGGAAGSLGGDLSAISVNPAGLGFYRTSEITVTPGFYFRSNQYNYLGTGTDQQKSGMALPQLGVVFGMPTHSNSKWKNVAFSLNYNRTADFNNKQYITGRNNSTTYSEKWLEDLTYSGAGDNEASLNFPLGASLAYQTFLIDPSVDANNNITGYTTKVNPANGITQYDDMTEKGGMGEFSLGLGTNYDHKLYLGMSLNFPTLNFERNRTFGEYAIGAPAQSDFYFFEHTTRLKTDGVGFNAKLGAIYAPMPALRLGAGFHTPTWYGMRDVSDASLLVNIGPSDDPSNDDYIVSGDLTDGFPVEYEYSMRTPWRGLVSASYIFGANSPDVSKQRGFITADAEYVNYASTKFKFNKGAQEDRAFAESLNRSISDMYKGAVNVRVGGEMKFNVLAVRAGFAYYGDPYANSSVDNSIKRISGGLGYRNRGFFLDLTYVHTLNKDEYLPYRLQEGNPVRPASVEMTGGNVVATVGLKF